MFFFRSNAARAKVTMLFDSSSSAAARWSGSTGVGVGASAEDFFLRGHIPRNPLIRADSRKETEGNGRKWKRFCGAPEAPGRAHSRTGRVFGNAEAIGPASTAGASVGRRGRRVSFRVATADWKWRRNPLKRRDSGMEMVYGAARLRHSSLSKAISTRSVRRPSDSR